MTQNPDGTTDILIVYGMHQANLYPQFHRDNVIPYLSHYRLRGLKPKRIFRTGLGLSRQSWRVREALEELHWKYGTELYRVEQYDDVHAEAGV
ncbi:hypothetical protein SEA_YOSIF_58 [Streptomyces phage Yosif]|uniref:Uncharacterized protein n=1 Tax=Streptomyces phage Yosif TaxID=2201421 RepID=A0A2Z4QCC4_9CAUD|nr:hypothetical protein KGG71_gp58 [Streptomyces phage Yosif]AWY07622.1 hypothetical protein SEA_YOSIF_58 [Streptomyces phage Yosif]